MDKVRQEQSLVRAKHIVEKAKAEEAERRERQKEGR